MIEAIKKRADYFIKLYENNPRELEKYVIIKDLLNKKNLFSQIDIEYAYSILRDLQIPEEELKKVYIDLLINK